MILTCVQHLIWHIVNSKIKTQTHLSSHLWKTIKTNRCLVFLWVAGKILNSQHAETVRRVRATLLKLRELRVQCFSATQWKHNVCTQTFSMTHEAFQLFFADFWSLHVKLFEFNKYPHIHIPLVNHFRGYCWTSGDWKCSRRSELLSSFSQWTVWVVGTVVFYCIGPTITMHLKINHRSGSAKFHLGRRENETKRLRWMYCVLECWRKVFCAGRTLTTPKKTPKIPEKRQHNNSNYLY